MAMENNHQIKAFAYSVSASQQDARIARGELLPKIAIEENLTRTDIPANVFSSKLNQQRFSSADLAGAPGTFNNPGYLNNYQTVFSIEQPLFAPAASAGRDIADKQSQAKGEEYQRVREEIVYRVIREYLTVHTAKEMVIACANSVHDADEHARISRLQYDANLGLYSDVLRASTAQKQAQQNLITAAEKSSHGQKVFRNVDGDTGFIRRRGGFSGGNDRADGTLYGGGDFAKRHQGDAQKYRSCAEKYRPDDRPIPAHGGTQGGLSA